jgi:hypothetical protein
VGQLRTRRIRFQVLDFFKQIGNYQALLRVGLDRQVTGIPP